MELLEAMEAMDASAAPAPPAPLHGDFFLQQVYYIHRELCAQWARQHRPRTPLRLPFAWVLSKLLRLIEEYPDGLTEAIVLTELAAQLHHRERLSIKRARPQPLAELVTENDEAVVAATVVSYTQHCIRWTLSNAETDERDPAGPPTARMFLHQRFRACMAAFASLGGASPDAPFVAGRQIMFTDAKLMEKKTRVADHETTVLPTPYLALRLTAADSMLQGQALSFAQVDVMASQELPGHEAPSLLQELVVKARVVDISAIRPCTTPYHVQRQVVMLTDVATASQPLSAVGSHVLILWDDQVALSRLFHVGDTLTLLHPFVHVCTPDDAEMVSVYEEYSSQQRCTYYLEYGSATTLFVSSHENDRSGVSNLGDLRAIELQPGEHHRDVSVGAVSKNWIGFSVYGHVAKIQVSHGIPLLAAFFYAYYDPKTQGRLAGAQRPSLDRAVVSKYYLVVLVDLYDKTSNSMLSLELTGETAVRALRLRVGQTVFIDGLVAVDMRGDPTIRSLRDEKTQLTLLTQTQDERVKFAFPNHAYRTPLVALSSDWESIFGSQSDVFKASRLFAINEIPGILRTRLPHHRTDDYLVQLLRTSETTSHVAMVATHFTVTKVGWLVPDSSDPTCCTWDESCERGYSTMLAHRACKHPLETAPPGDASSPPLPRWKCSFCNEIFMGMDATIQTYCDLALRIDDGSLSHHVVHAVCHGDVVSVLLGVPAESFSQLSLPAKRSALRRAVGKDYHAVLSRSRVRTVAVPSLHLAVDLRVDQLQPVDAFAAAQTRRTQLTQR